MELVSQQKMQIARTVDRDWRGTRRAKFERPDGWYICDAWFENGVARMQIRSGAEGLEEPGIIMAGIQMARDWIIEEIAAGRNVLPADLHREAV